LPQLLQIVAQVEFLLQGHQPVLRFNTMSAITAGMSYRLWD